MKHFKIEIENRIQFIRDCLYNASASGIVYGNSGGKDSALTGVLCKMACKNTVGLILPCGSQRNYNEDQSDAIKIANQFGIETRLINLQSAKDDMEKAMEQSTHLTSAAISNLAPRLRMTALYAVAASENRLVAGTGNKSENYMGYFTKWGDGAFDFNPIADLTVTEIYEFLKYLDAPVCVLEKAPSAGLYDGQTDEKEMGVSYENIDLFLNGGAVSPADRRIIEKYHGISEHKRQHPIVYGGKQ